MLSDHRILRSLQDSEVKGFDILFQRYYKPLVIFVDTYLHDLQYAEDLVQDQLVKLWSKKALDKIAPEALSSFLFTVMKNAAINWLEKKRVLTKSIDLPHYQIAAEEAQQLDETVVATIRDALDQLPEKTRLVVTAVMIKDMMYKEAAEELGVSVNTVKTLLRQGVRDLRNQLGDSKAWVCFFYLLSHRSSLLASLEQIDEINKNTAIQWKC